MLKAMQQEAWERVQSEQLVRMNQETHIVALEAQLRSFKGSSHSILDVVVPGLGG